MWKSWPLKFKATWLTCTSTMWSSFSFCSSGGIGKFEPTFPDNSALTGPSFSSYIARKKKANKNCFIKQFWNNIKDHLFLYFTTKTVSCTHLTLITFVHTFTIHLPAFPSLPLHLKCTLSSRTSSDFFISPLVPPSSTMC